MTLEEKREAHRIYMRGYYKEHREYFIDKAMDWQRQNKDRYLENNRLWRHENKDKVAAINSRYYARKRAERAVEQ